MQPVDDKKTFFILMTELKIISFHRCEGF